MVDEKKFSQVEVNALMKRCNKERDAELSKLRQEIADRDTVIGAARARVAELEPLAAVADTERAAHRALTRGQALGRAMDESRCLAIAKRHAIMIFGEEFDLAESDSGEITGATRRSDGTRFESLKDAAAAFMKENPHFVAAGRPPVGGGSVRERSTGSTYAPFGPPKADLSKADPVDLINRGLQKPADQERLP